jgi:hypothetical protein
MKNAGSNKFIFIDDLLLTFFLFRTRSIQTRDSTGIFSISAMTFIKKIIQSKI